MECSNRLINESGIYLFLGSSVHETRVAEWKQDGRGGGAMMCESLAFIRTLVGKLLHVIA
jgi:hypothetical protein